jgi:hypothetical protein
MTRLLLDVDAFFFEHRLCGDLDGGTTDERAWLACIACGARIERLVEASGFRASIASLHRMIEDRRHGAAHDEPR